MLPLAAGRLHVSTISKFGWTKSNLSDTCLPSAMRFRCWFLAPGRCKPCLGDKQRNLNSLCSGAKRHSWSLIVYELWCKVITTQLDECQNNREYWVSNKTLFRPAIVYYGYKGKQSYAEIIMSSLVCRGIVKAVWCWAVDSSRGLQTGADMALTHSTTIVSIHRCISMLSTVTYHTLRASSYCRPPLRAQSASITPSWKIPTDNLVNINLLNLWLLDPKELGSNRCTRLTHNRLCPRLHGRKNTS